jgi:hypothetical protein
MRACGGGKTAITGCCQLDVTRQEAVACISTFSIYRGSQTLKASYAQASIHEAKAGLSSVGGVMAMAASIIANLHRGQRGCSLS